MPDQHGAEDGQRRQKLVEIAGEPVHRPAVLGAVGRAVAPLIVGHGTRHAGDWRRDRTPVLRAAQPAVDEYDGPAGALVDVAEVDPVGGEDLSQHTAVGDDRSVADRCVLSRAHARLLIGVLLAQRVWGRVSSVGSDERDTP